MKLTNELHRTSVTLPDGRSATGIVRVRGVDARLGGRGFIFEDRAPVALDLPDGAGSRRIAIEAPSDRAALLAVVAAPVVSRLIARMLRKGAR